MTIFRLYRIDGAAKKYLLIRTERESFSNANQNEADFASTNFNAAVDKILKKQQAILNFTNASLMATWEDGYPKGDIFYSNTSNVAVDIWFALGDEFPDYFVFGIANTESSFWESLEELYDDGLLCASESFRRPARKETVWLIQQRVKWQWRHVIDCLFNGSWFNGLKS